MEGQIQNILIAGIGGQGVNTLSSVIQRILLDKGQFCKGAIFKGGAQKRGTVYSTIRIFKDEDQGKHMSSTLPKNELHTLLSLEATESLRYAKYFNLDTNMIINDFRFPFYNERYKGKIEEVNIKNIVEEHFPKASVLDLSSKSEELFGDDSMINVLLGLEAINNHLLPIDAVDFLDIFQQKTKITYERMMILMDLCEI